VQYGEVEAIVWLAVATDRALTQVEPYAAATSYQ